MKSLLLRILPHFVAVLVFAVVASSFFNLAYEGYDLRQGDIAQFKGMSKEIVDYRTTFGEEPLWTNSMFGGMPAYQISLAQSRNVPHLIQMGVRKMFPGPVGPLFLAMLSFYVLGLCLRVNPWLAIGGAVAFGLSSIHILYLGAGHLSKVNAIALMPGVLGGVILTFRGKLLTGAAVTALFLGMHVAANHLQMTYYLVFLVAFVVISEMIRLILAKEAKRAIVAAAVLAGAALIAVLPNMTTMMTTYGYSKYTTRGETELTRTADGQAATADGLNRTYMLEYSMSRGEFWSMLVPNIKGGQSGAIGADRENLQKVSPEYVENVAQSNRYWGDQLFTGGAFYFGAFMMALFIIALFAARDRLKWPFLILSILAIMLSWKDTNFIGDFFIDHVPLFAKFRDTKMMLVVISVMAPALVLLFLQELLERADAARQKLILIGSAAVLVILIAFVAAPGALLDFVSPQEHAQFDSFITDSNGDAQTERYIQGLIGELETVRQGIMRTDALRSLLFALLAVGMVIGLDRKKLPLPAAFAALAIFVLIDQYSVNRRYLDNEQVGKDYVHWQPAIEKQYPHHPTPADELIHALEFDTRTSLLSEVNTQAKAAQDAAQRNIEILNRQEREMYRDRIAAAVQSGVLNLNSNYRVLNLRNPFADARTSYFHKSLGGYHGAKLRRYQELIDFHLNDEMERFFTNVNEVGLSVLEDLSVINMLNAKYLIYDVNSEPLANPYANGNAWFVSDVDWAGNGDEEIDFMNGFDSKSTAVINREFKELVPQVLQADSSASITLTDYLPNHLEYVVECSTTQLAVFSEIYYPDGWQAYINDEPVDHIRANYVLRALPIPAGKHTVTFKFEPAAYATGQTLAGLGSILFVLLLAGSAFAAYRQRNTDVAA